MTSDDERRALVRSISYQRNESKVYVCGKGDECMWYVCVSVQEAWRGIYIYRERFDVVYVYLSLSITIPRPDNGVSECEMMI